MTARLLQKPSVVLQGSRRRAISKRWTTTWSTSWRSRTGETAEMVFVAGLGEDVGKWRGYWLIMVDDGWWLMMMVMRIWGWFQGHHECVGMLEALHRLPADRSTWNMLATKQRRFARKRCQGFHSHGGSPRAGWFLLGILQKWMMTGGPPISGNHYLILPFLNSCLVGLLGDVHHCSSIDIKPINNSIFTFRYCPFISQN